MALKKDRVAPKSQTDCTEPSTKSPLIKRKIMDYCSEFSENTALHGFKYIGDQKLSVFERVLWLLVFTVSLYFCIALIVKTYIRWDNYPVLVTFARSSTPVWKIPFPAVTICPELKIKQRAYNFTYYLHMVYEDNYTMSEEEWRDFTTAVLVCHNHLYQNGSTHLDLRGFNQIVNMAPQFDDVFHECEWMGEIVPCKDFFVPIMTEDGLCFSSNMLHRDQIYTKNAHHMVDNLNIFPNSEGWTLETGYPEGAKIDTYPRRALSSGSSAGLFVTLKGYTQDMDYICRGPVQGFKVLFHHPSQVPRASRQYFRVAFNEEITVSVKPNMMTTSDGLKSYEPHRRRCFYPEERQLYFFETYTQQNCRVECYARFYAKQCGCTPFYQPRDNNTPICGNLLTKCIYKARQDLLFLEVSTEMNGTITDCDCLPACTSIKYNVETSQAAYEWVSYYQSIQNNFTMEEGIQLAKIGVFFKEMQFITSERNELYGQTDFWASCGSFLGLFTGFSFLTIVEIIYFLSLRLIGNIFIHKRKIK